MIVASIESTHQIAFLEVRVAPRTDAGLVLCRQRVLLFGQSARL